MLKISYSSGNKKDQEGLVPAESVGYRINL